MSVLIPVLLFVCLAAGFVLVPLAAPWRARRRFREVAANLVASYGFSADPKLGPEQVPWSAPPFHYGHRAALVDPVRGAFAGLSAEVFGYTCRENGVVHSYGVAVIHLHRRLPVLEVREEPVFTSTQVYYVPAYPHRLTGVEEFDTRYRASGPDEQPVLELLAPGFARVMLTAPEAFDLRIEGPLMVLTRRDGWTSAAALVGCCLAAVHAIAPLIDLDPDQFNAPRLIGGLGAG
jgi:hypothetical protein